MILANSSFPLCPRTRHQDGQALIYGLFVLIGGLAALFFMFNTGQLTGEKTKLVSTADAVAYSAGVMHARALNFDAYTNRALMANEVMIAQAVSIASWSKHVVAHTENVPPLFCQTFYSRPVALVLVTYVPVCYLLSLPFATQAATGVDMRVQAAAMATVTASEVAKAALQKAQKGMALALVPARSVVMQQVADANYLGDGVVRVDTVPITDNFSSVDGKPFIRAYSGAERGRFRNATVEAANRDDFVRQRTWTSANKLPCILGNKAEFRRRGGTELIGFDEWKAMDTASLHQWRWHMHGFFRRPTCDDEETALGYAAQAAADGSPDDSGAAYGDARTGNPDASARASSDDFQYSGLPTFYDLSGSALQYAATDPGPRLRFSIRLTRAKGQLNTSDGTSHVKPTGKLAHFEGHPASGVLAAVATSEVFFNRPVARADGTTELASLFNPFWEVRLIPTSDADLAQALARGGPQ